MTRLETNYGIYLIFMYGLMQILMESIRKIFYIYANLLCLVILINLLMKLISYGGKSASKSGSIFLNASGMKFMILEFILNKYPDYKINKFIESCNSVLTTEMSAYRIVDKRFLSITNNEEIKEIEEVIVSSKDSVTMHMRRALELLSNRNSPDYRNSIKESISAVESLAADIMGKKGTLGQLLKELEQKIGLHPALRDAFNKLYGYTNDSNGIRHAIFDSDNLSFDDAKFFLVACSAFINYIKIKIK